MRPARILPLVALLSLPLTALVSCGGDGGGGGSSFKGGIFSFSLVSAEATCQNGSSSGPLSSVLGNLSFEYPVPSGDRLALYDLGIELVSTGALPVDEEALPFDQITSSSTDNGDGTTTTTFTALGFPSSLGQEPGQCDGDTNLTLAITPRSDDEITVDATMTLVNYTGAGCPFLFQAFLQVNAFGQPCDLDAELLGIRIPEP